MTVFPSALFPSQDFHHYHVQVRHGTLLRKQTLAALCLHLAESLNAEQEKEVRFQVLSAASRKTRFWVLARCSFVEVD
jgi:hypothetical protein